MIKYNSFSFNFVISLVILFISFSLLVSEINNAGLTWDEANFIPAGRKHIIWIKEIFSEIFKGNFRFIFNENFIDKQWSHTAENPPLAKVLSGLSGLVFENIVGVLGAHRMSNLIIFCLFLIIIYRSVKREYGNGAALLSLLVLFSMPRVVGHARLAALDLPMAFFWYISIYSFYLGLKNHKWRIASAIFLGLAILTKHNALMIPFILVLWSLFYREKKALKSFLWMAIIAPFVVIILWPWLWPAVFKRLYFVYIWTKFIRADIPVYYLGNAYKTSPFPWHYAWVMSLVTIPLAVIFGILCSPYQRVKRDPFYGILLLNILFPLFIFSLPTTPRYDGVRLFLHIFPFMAIVSGLGLMRLFTFLYHKFGRALAIIICCVCLFFMMVPVFGTHSYKLSYYNKLIGGPRGAARYGFETTYWGDTCDINIFTYLYQNIPSKAKISFFPFGSRAIEVYKTLDAIREGIEVIPWDKDRTDFLVLNFRQGMFDDFIWTLVKTKSPLYASYLDGAILTAVYQIK